MGSGVRGGEERDRVWEEGRNRERGGSCPNICYHYLNVSHHHRKEKTETNLFQLPSAIHLPHASPLPPHPQNSSLTNNLGALPPLLHPRKTNRARTPPRQTPHQLRRYFLPQQPPKFIHLLPPFIPLRRRKGKWEIG